MKSRMKIFRLNNLIGGLNTIAEEDALASFDYTGVGTACEFRDMENWMPIYRGGLTKAFGYVLFNATGSIPVTGLYRFIRSDGTNLFLYSAGTKVYKLISGTATDLGATVANNAYLDFETATDRCVICDGVNAPVFYDGAAMTTIANGAPVGARQSLFYQNRLWIFGGPANPSLLYYSSVNDITSGYSSQFINCDTNDGQKITAIAKFFIPNSLVPIIMVAKDRSVGIVTGDGSTGNPYTFMKISNDYGVPGFRQIVQFGQTIAYLTPVGVSSFNAGYSQVKLFSQYLSEKIRNKFAGFNAAYLKDALSWYDYLNTRISFAFPEESSPYPNVVYHYDVRLNCWYKERFGSTSTITASLIDSDGTWYHGDSAGNIYQHGTTYNSYDGAAISAYFTLPYLDFGVPGVRKQIKQARMTLRTQGAYSVGVSHTMDYGARYGKTNTVSVNGGFYTWNGGLWSNNPMVYQWGASPIKTLKFYPAGLFYSIQPTVSQPGGDQPVDIFEIEYVTEFEAF